MSNNTQQSAFRRQASSIVLGGGIVVAIIIILGLNTLARFSGVEAAWVDHTKRATAIGHALSNLNRHIGYGGFIHHLKNTVLRLDIDRYQAALENDISGLTADITLLSSLLIDPKDQKAIAQVKLTFDDYISKYKMIRPMITQLKSPTEIDKVIKVSDKAAIEALDQLANRARERALVAARKAEKEHVDAVYFLKITGFTVILSVLIAMAIMVVFLRRVVVANELILETQRRLDDLLDMSPDPMLSVSKDGHIVRANKMAQKFFGYSLTELQSMSIESLIPERHRANHPVQRDNYFKDPSQRAMGELRSLKALTKDGSEPDVEISLSHSGEGASRLATITIRDITERERNRIELDRARQNAEDALVRQQQLQDGLVEAEKMAALGSLVAGIAHEINTPIGVALTSATHLESETQKADALYKAGEMTEESLAEYFATANQVAHMLTLNSQRASDLILGFKQVAVDQTADECRTFNLAEYINEILLSLRPHLKKRPIQVHIDCADNVMVYGFAGAVSQILTNFITNSLRYAFDEDQPGHITISVQATDDVIKLTYQDDGKGIARDLQSTVFDPFVTTGRGAGGSGLGLHIVYNVVTQKLKGDIDLTSTPGEGVTFTISFPRHFSETGQDIRL